jgi:hypothetical protein
MVVTKTYPNQAVRLNSAALRVVGGGKSCNSLITNRLHSLIQTCVESDGRLAVGLCCGVAFAKSVFNRHVQSLRCADAVKANATFHAIPHVVRGGPAPPGSAAPLLAGVNYISPILYNYNN